MMIILFPINSVIRVLWVTLWKWAYTFHKNCLRENKDQKATATNPEVHVHAFIRLISNIYLLCFPAHLPAMQSGTITLPSLTNQSNVMVTFIMKYTFRGESSISIHLFNPSNGLKQSILFDNSSNYDETKTVSHIAIGDGDQVYKY